MIEPIRDLPPGVSGFRAKGRITPSEYRETVLPTLRTDPAAQEGGRLLFVAGPEFEGYSGFDGATPQDADFRLERIAFVSDRQHYGDAVKAFGWPYPRQAQVYPERALDRAVEWLAEDR